MSPFYGNQPLERYVKLRGTEMETIRGYDAWKTRTPWEDDPEHLLSCPLHDDNYDEESADDDGAVCECPTTAELKYYAAEARADARREEW